MDMDRCISERFLLYPSFVSMHTAYSQTLFPITTGMLHISPSEELQPHGKSWSLNSRDVQCCLQRVVADTLLMQSAHDVNGSFDHHRNGFIPWRVGKFDYIKYPKW